MAITKNYIYYRARKDFGIVESSFIYMIQVCYSNSIKELLLKL